MEEQYSSIETKTTSKRQAVEFFTSNSGRWNRIRKPEYCEFDPNPDARLNKGIVIEHLSPSGEIQIYALAIPESVARRYWTEDCGEVEARSWHRLWQDFIVAFVIDSKTKTLEQRREIGRRILARRWVRMPWKRDA